MLACRTSVTCIACVAMAGGLLPALPAAAADVSGSVAITTDYIYRGQSHSAGQPAAQAGIQFHSSGWNAGMWGSSVDFRERRGHRLRARSAGRLHVAAESGLVDAARRRALRVPRRSRHRLRLRRGHGVGQLSATRNSQRLVVAEYFQAHLPGIRLGQAGDRVRALVAPAAAFALVGCTPASATTICTTWLTPVTGTGAPASPSRGRTCRSTCCTSTPIPRPPGCSTAAAAGRPR